MGAPKFQTPYFGCSTMHPGKALTFMGSKRILRTMSSRGKLPGKMHPGEAIIHMGDPAPKRTHYVLHSCRWYYMRRGKRGRSLRRSYSGKYNRFFYVPEADGVSERGSDTGHIDTGHSEPEHIAYE